MIVPTVRFQVRRYVCMHQRVAIGPLARLRETSASVMFLDSSWLDDWALLTRTSILPYASTAVATAARRHRDDL